MCGTQGRSLGKGWAALKQDHEQQQRLRFNFCATVTRDLVRAEGRGEGRGREGENEGGKERSISNARGK